MRSTRGVAALEFAILFPVFMAVLIAIIDYGWLFYYRAAMDSATNTGCRAGSLVDPGEFESNIADVQDRAKAVTSTTLSHLGIACDGRCGVDATPFGTNPGRSLQCTLNYDFDPLVGLYLAPLTMQSLQVSRLEYQR